MEPLFRGLIKKCLQKQGLSSMKINYSVKRPFRGQAEDKRKFSLNRSVPSVMVTDTKMKEKDIKSGSVAASLEESVAYIEVSRIKFLNYYKTSRK